MKKLLQITIFLFLYFPVFSQENDTVNNFVEKTELKIIVDEFNKSIKELKDSNITYNEIFINKSEFETKIKDLNNSIQMLKNSNKNLNNQLQITKENVKTLKTLVSKQKIKIDSLNKYIKNTNNKLIGINNNISKIENNTQSKIKNINESISNKTLYWIIAFLIVSILCIIIYVILRKNLKINTTNFDKQIVDTKKILEKETTKLDEKLVQLLTKQLSLIKEENSRETKEEKLDHSLPIRVGNEIHRMRKRIKNMPEDTIGINALKSALSRLEEEFNDNDYEIIDLMGKKYIEGRTIKSRFVPDYELKKDEMIITKIIKPQINYKGKLIQVPDVEVSVGEKEC